MSTFIWKPSTVNSWKRGPVFLAPAGTSGTPVIIGPDGKRYNGKYVNTNEGRKQWVFPADLVSMENLQVEYGGQTSEIGSGSTSYEGSSLGNLQARGKGSLGAGGFSTGPGGSSLGNLQARGKGSLGAGGFSTGPGGSSAGYLPPGTQGGGVNGSVANPYYLGGYPEFQPIQYNPIESAPFDFTDPAAFGAGYAPATRKEFLNNQNLANSLALDQLDLELQGLQGFVPAAAALKRREINRDNLFNQDERTSQLDRALPGTRLSLQQQGDRANTYARGRVPNEIDDRALELGARSRASDVSRTRGFGDNSILAGKTSDLMSAEQRLQIAQYGEGLLSKNISDRSAFELAPTQYSNAGSQVNVLPEVGAGRASRAIAGEINQQTLIPATQALSSTINQNQYITSQEQATRVFNTANDINTQQFNSTGQFNRDLGKFNYDQGYLAEVQGATQAGLNQTREDERRDFLTSQYEDAIKSARKRGDVGSVLEGLGSFLGLGGKTGTGGRGSGSISESIISGIGGLLDFGSDSSSSAGTGSLTESPDVQAKIDEGAAAVDGPSIAPVAGVEDTDRSGGFAYNDDDFTPAARSRIALNSNQIAEFGSPIAAKYARTAERDADHNLALAGISKTPKQGYVEAGIDSQGNRLFSKISQRNNRDISSGVKTLASTVSLLEPLGVLNEGDRKVMGAIGEASRDAASIARLTSYAQNGDKKAFIRELQRNYGDRILKKTLPEADYKKYGSRINAGLYAGLQGEYLFSNWNNLSPGQKAITTANVGLRSYEAATGERLSKRFIPGTDNKMNVGQAMNLLATGYDAYSLAQNWQDMDTLGRAAGVTSTVANLAELGKQLNLFGNTAAGATAAQSGGAQLTQTGLSQGSSAAAAPAAGEVGLGSILGPVAGAAAFAVGAKGLSKSWGEGGASGRRAGLMNGLSMATGLTLMGQSNPPLLAATVGLSVLGSTIKTGKHSDQLKRDVLRKDLKDNNIVDSNFKLTLPDGTQADLGKEDSEVERHFTNKNELTDDHKKLANKKLKSYEVDYTNDLDYTSALVGQAFTKLRYGGSNMTTDQLAGSLANAALKNIGYGKENSQENFGKLMQNYRSIFAKAGITTKRDAQAMANQLTEKGNLSGVERAAVEQALNLAFDNNYKAALSLNAGRRPAARAEQKQNPETRSDNAPQKKTPTRNFKKLNAPLSKEEIRARNQRKYFSNEAPPPSVDYSGGA